MACCGHREPRRGGRQRGSGPGQFSPISWVYIPHPTYQGSFRAGTRLQLGVANAGGQVDFTSGNSDCMQHLLIPLYLSSPFRDQTDYSS